MFFKLHFAVPHNETAGRKLLGTTSTRKNSLHVDNTARATSTFFFFSFLFQITIALPVRWYSTCHARLIHAIAQEEIGCIVQANAQVQSLRRGPRSSRCLGEEGSRQANASANREAIEQEPHRRPSPRAEVTAVAADIHRSAQADMFQKHIHYFHHCNQLLRRRTQNVLPRR